MEEEITWWLWVSYLETPDEDILLYSALLPNNNNYDSLNTKADSGSMDIELGQVSYFSRVLSNELAESVLENVSENGMLNLSIIDSSITKEFSIICVRQVIGSTFGQTVVPITAYYTTPNLTTWNEHLEELTNVLLLLKSELNLPFDRDYMRKFGNFEIHKLSNGVDTAVSVQLINGLGNENERAHIRVAKKEPLFSEQQTLHVICREKKDVIFHKLLNLESGKSEFRFDGLPEDSYELECRIFNSFGEIIYQDHQYYIASIGINTGVVGRQINLEDELTRKSKGAGKEVAKRAATVRRTHTERSLISARNSPKYHDFDTQIAQLHPILFPESSYDVWFGKSIANEVNVIKHFQSIIDNGKAEKAILVDPFFGADAFERFVTRVEESKLDLTILTSLGKIDPDTGKIIDSDADPVYELKKAILKTRNLINCKVKLINLNLSSSKQAFHDRYLVVYPFDEMPIVYMLSNSINKMAGNWPFCMAKIEPATAQHIREYIEGLCKGVDSSREGNPVITYQWPGDE